MQHACTAGVFSIADIRVQTLTGCRGSNTEIGDSAERSSISDKVVEGWMAGVAEKQLVLRSRERCCNRGKLALGVADN